MGCCNKLQRRVVHFFSICVYFFIEKQNCVISSITRNNRQTFSISQHHRRHSDLQLCVVRWKSTDMGPIHRSKYSKWLWLSVFGSHLVYFVSHAQDGIHESNLHDIFTLVTRPIDGFCSNLCRPTTPSTQIVSENSQIFQRNFIFLHQRMGKCWSECTLKKRNSISTLNWMKLVSIDEFSLCISRCLQIRMCNACGRKSAVRIRKYLILTYVTLIGRNIHITTSKECVSICSKTINQHSKRHEKSGEGKQKALLALLPFNWIWIWISIETT